MGKLTGVRTFKVLQSVPALALDTGAVLMVNYSKNIMTSTRNGQLEWRVEYTPGVFDFSNKKLFEEIWEKPAVGKMYKIVLKTGLSSDSQVLASFKKANGHSTSKLQHSFRNKTFVIGTVESVENYTTDSILVKARLTGGSLLEIVIDRKELDKRIQDSGEYWYLSDKGSLKKTYAGLDQTADKWRNDHRNMFGSVELALSHLKADRNIVPVNIKDLK